MTFVYCSTVCVINFLSNMDAKDNKIAGNMMIKCADKLIDLSTPLVMGIVNITPDSFYAGSRVTEQAMLLSRIQTFISEGVDIVDIGAVSTRPGADDVSEELELERVQHALKMIVKQFPNVPISIDTFRSSVARMAVVEGAHIINDVSGGDRDPRMFDVVAQLNVPYILMHSRGDSKTMQELTEYEDVTMDVIRELSEKVTELRQKGVKDIIVDPGFGFAKTTEQNFKLLSELSLLEVLGCPVLAGISRKSMIYKTLNTSPLEALNGTSALNMTALMNGAKILRVHDVKKAREVVELYRALIGSF